MQVAVHDLQRVGDGRGGSGFVRGIPGVWEEHECDQGFGVSLKGERRESKERVIPAGVLQHIETRDLISYTGGSSCGGGAVREEDIWNAL